MSFPYPAKRRSQRAFSRDAEHRGYGPDPQAMPPATETAGAPNRTDQGGTFTTASVPRSTASSGNYSNVPPLERGEPGRGRGKPPGLPGLGNPAPGSRAEDIESFKPSDRNDDGRGIGQPSIPTANIVFREVVGKYPFADAGGRFNYWTENSGSGQFAVWRTRPGNGTGDAELVASFDGICVGDANLDQDFYVVTRLQQRTDLGKSTFDRRMFDAQLRHNHATTLACTNINRANREKYR